MERSKKWCFTVNNPPEFTEETAAALKQLTTFVIIGLETGESGTPHWQGYLETDNRKTRTALSKWFSDTLNLNPHLERSKGTAIENIKYCSKDGHVLIGAGKPAIQGRRTDLEAIKLDIDNGKCYNDLWNDHFSHMCQYRKSFAEYIDSRNAKRTTMPDVFIYWGATGTGKTRKAMEFSDDPFIYMGGGWFDGYTGQSVAIFDEFEGGDVPFELWKRLCDRYPLRVPIKGGSVNWNPRIIIFTSNRDPRNWWRDVDKPDGWWDQFQRRTKEIVHFNTPI